MPAQANANVVALQLEYDEHAFAVMDDAVPAFHAQPFVCVGT